jgi:hypothetical protein
MEIALLFFFTLQEFEFCIASSCGNYENCYATISFAGQVGELVMAVDGKGNLSLALQTLIKGAKNAP